MTFFDKLIKNCNNWDELISDNKFIKKLITNEINDQQFYEFWIQSNLYMRIFNKCFRVLRNSDHSFENADFCDYFLSRMKNIKTGLTNNIYNFKIQNSEHIKMNAATLEYVNYLLNIANDYNYSDLLIALAPCIISYGYFFQMFLAFEKSQGKPIEFGKNATAASKWYHSRNRKTFSYSTLKCIKYLNYWADNNEHDFEQLSDLFNIAVECEVNFFYIITNDKLIEIF